MIDKYDSDVPSSERVLILGSSPSMPRYADEAFEKCDKILTTNAGVYECLFQGRTPDVYAVVEVDTPRLFGRYYRAFQERGTKIVTIDLALANDPNFEREADEILRVLPIERFSSIGNVRVRKGYYSDQTKYEPGKYVGCSASGGYLLQYAMNVFAPREIWLVGMEGYRSTPADRVVDTFDGRLGNKAGSEYTSRLYGPLIQQVVSAWPTTTFVVCGKPVYTLEGDNVVRLYKPKGDEATLSAKRIE